MRFFREQKIEGKSLEFSATGHSLGGGLAQAVLYEQVNSIDFSQAYAFSPSPATAYTSRIDKSEFAPYILNENYPEPRIYRIYESYEILSNLRIPHKMIFPPERWINEVRFNFVEGPIRLNSILWFD